MSLTNGGDTLVKNRELNMYHPIAPNGPFHPIASANFFENNITSSSGLVKFE